MGVAAALLFRAPVLRRMNGSHHRWLNRFAVFTALATLGLIWMGGLVTSHGVGMAVPDWPTTYGYNLFFFPISQWVGGIFYEHAHRLLAAFIGLLTSILAGWLWVRETHGRARWFGLSVIILMVMMLSHRGSGQATGGLDGVPIHFRALAVVMPVLLGVGVWKTFQTGGSLRWLGMTAFFAVIFQGILGGFRVANMQDALGIFHATLAQLFFALVGVIAVLTSRWWLQADFSAWQRGGIGAIRRGFAVVAALIFVQLVVAATMRHQHAGLAISDFPLAHGKVWPDTDETSVMRYNQQRGEVRALNPITAAQIHLQMMHRILALLIVLGVAWMAGATLKRVGPGSAPGRLALFWLGLLFVQVALGAATIWTNKAADIATAHVAVGALCFVTGIGLTLLGWRCERANVPRRDSSLTTQGIGFDAHSVKASA